MDVLIFGAGYYGKICKTHVEQSPEYTLLGFLDNAAQKPVIEDLKGNPIPVYSPEDGVLQNYDMILISNVKASQISEIRSQLISLGVPKEKIQALFEDEALVAEFINQYDEDHYGRVVWLRDFAHYAQERGMEGSVAECGVCWGEFAQYINKYFPEKTLYLFDTFEGFDNGDLDAERSLADENFLNGAFNQNGLFSPENRRIALERVVMKRMLHPENCVLKKGYFPDTAAGLDDTFCFVNLDMDLYKPMLAGLRFFYEKMCPGGVILLHDYFHQELPGVKRAVSDFEKEHGSVCKTPIGDFGSIAIIKP